MPNNDKRLEAREEPPIGSHSVGKDLDDGRAPVWLVRDSGIQNVLAIVRLKHHRTVAGVESICCHCV